MQIETGRGSLFPGCMRKARGRHGLVGIGVRTKAQVTINSQQRAAAATRVDDKVRTHLVKAWPKILDEFQKGILNEGFVSRLICLKPIAIVMPLELFQ